MKHRSVRIGAVAVAGLLVLWIGSGYAAAYLLTHPPKTAIHSREELGGRRIENVTLTSQDGVSIEAWYTPNEGDRAVILLAGIGAERRQTVRHGEYYVQLGYTVLMPDLRASGNSGGDVVSMGWFERYDLEACRKFLVEKGYKHIGADGISLGAATICYSLQDNPDWAFIVLESAYHCIDSALEHRLDLFHVPHFAALPVQWFTERIVGVSPEMLRPIDYMPLCTAPALIMAGDSEAELPLYETEALFEKCGAPLKRLHVFKGGRHQNFLKFFPDEYKETLKVFLTEVESGWGKPTAAADAA
jgi:alpha-beta hydrolase superfamily lysophospholipase